MYKLYMYLVSSDCGVGDDVLLGDLQREHQGPTGPKHRIPGAQGRVQGEEHPGSCILYTMNLDESKGQSIQVAACCTL